MLLTGGLGALLPAGPPPPPAGVAGTALLSARGNRLRPASAWRVSGGAGAAAGARLHRTAGREWLEFPIPFSRTPADRVYWDGPVDADLSTASAVLLDIWVQNPGALRGISLYFRSGGGWYSASVFPKQAEQWCRVRVAKTAFSSEDAPAGWGRVDQIRVSPWRAGNRDAVLHVANLAAVGTGGPVVLIRKEAPASEPEAGAAKAYAETCANLLRRAGVQTGIVGTPDLTPEMLRGRRLAIVPYAPAMSERTAGILADFTASGGKVICCYTIPSKLRRILGFELSAGGEAEYHGQFAALRPVPGVLPGAPASTSQASWRANRSRPSRADCRVAAWWHDSTGKRTDVPAILVSSRGAYISHVLIGDDPANKAALLRALVLALCPAAGPATADGALAALGTDISAGGWTEAVRSVAALPHVNPGARAALDLATTWRSKALQAKAAGRWHDVFTCAAHAREQLVRAYCLAQRPVDREFRGAWCHAPYGIRGISWEQSAEGLARAGISDLIVNMLWGGSAAYPSSVMPLATHAGPGRDHLAECVAACSARGIRVHVWIVNWRVGSSGHMPAAGQRRFASEGRLQVNRAGETTDWLCPSDPRNRALQADAMLEAAQRPGVSGIHFDYIRYPDEDACFCNGCRKRFEAALGQRVGTWPADVLRAGPRYGPWVDFRCNSITALVRMVRTRQRRAAPKCLVSAAVFKNYPSCRQGVGQDWKRWVDEGLLDFICPMNYSASEAQFGSLVASHLRIVNGKIPLFPGIGSHLDIGAVGTIRQINRARSLGARGWVIFPYGSVTAQSVFPYLGLGVNRARR